MFERRSIIHPWEGKMTQFKIIGNVFIGNHVWNNNTYEYGKLLLETGENRFVDQKLWGTFLDFCEKRLDSVIEKENSL